MKLSKTKDQSFIDFIDIKEETPKESKPTKASSESKFKMKAAQKSDNSKAIENYSNKSILSAGGGSVLDIGGPSKYIGSQTNNSIFDTSVIERNTGKKDNGEIIKETNKNIEKVRNGYNQERMDEMVDNLKNTDTRKQSSVSSLSEYGSTKNYQKPTTSISIFDNLDEKAFGRLADKTDGEKITDRAKQKKEKDDSWKNNFGTKKITSDLLSGLFNSDKNNE